MNTKLLHQKVIILSLLFTFLFSINQAQTMPSVKVSGEVSKPLVLYAEDLLRMKHTDLTFKDFSGLEYHYSGVALSEILLLAGGLSSRPLQGEDLAKYLLVKGSDGSEVLFSLSELNPNPIDQTIILADQMNGKPLPQGTGPFRIIVPKEKERTRWIWEVTTMVIRYAKE